MIRWHVTYVEMFPTAQVYSFEPFFGSFEQLRTNMINYPNVHVYNIGLSDRRGRQHFYSNTYAPTNSLLEPSAAADDTWGKGVVRAQALVECEFTTLDEFIEENNIPSIDILKMDVQGSETKVLNGAKRALQDERIALIYSEVITMPTYKDQPKLWEILRAFDEYGMALHNVYNVHFTNVFDGHMWDVPNELPIAPRSVRAGLGNLNGAISGVSA